MKHLYLIGGTMGVGKSSTGQALKRLLPGSVFLDGDWCWEADPFVVTEETKVMVMDNITHLLQNFLDCSAYENVIFCWVMHEQAIIDDILSRLDTGACRIHCISLVCGEACLRQRLEEDISRGLRSRDVLERSVARLGLYEGLNTEILDTTALTAEDTAREIAKKSHR